MLSLDVIDVKGEKDNELSQNAFDPNISSVEIKPVTTFKKLYEYHRKKFPKVKVSNSNKEFKETAAICLQELLQLNDHDVFENEMFQKKINNFHSYFPTLYKKCPDRKQMFINYKKFFENEFNILPTNNSYPVQSDQDTIVEEVEGDQEISKNEFNPDMSSVDIKPITTFKELYECHRKRFPNVRVSNSNSEFKETSAICLQELLQLDKKDILENEMFKKKIQNFVDHVPNHYEKKEGNRYRMFKSHKQFYEREFNIVPSNNSNLIYEEIEGNLVNDNEIHLDMSCDEIRPHTSYKKLFQYHRSRFSKVRVGYQKEFKETSEICLQELLQLDKKDILENEKFQQKIKDFVRYAPRYYDKKNYNRNKMFAAYKQFFEREFTILPSIALSHANKSDKNCGTVIVKDLANFNDMSNDISNDISNDMSDDFSNKFINDELELHPDVVHSSEKLDEIENNIEHQTLDNDFKFEISEEFLSKILKAVDELCDDIKNGDPDIERMLQVNLNLNNAVSCYKNMLSLRKQNFVQKKNQEHVNHMTREIMQSYHCDYEYIDKDFKDNQITIGLENFGQSDDKDDNRGFENLQSEGNRKSRKRKRLKKEIVVKNADKKLENGMDSLLSESENTLIEKQTESKDQMINQDSGNAAFERTEKVFNYDDISDIQSYPYLRFDNEKGMFQCSICNHFTRKRSDSLKHIKQKHKKEIRSKEEGLNDIIVAESDNCQKSFCKKLYGSHGVGRRFWCKECKKLRISIKKKQIRKKELCQECGKNVRCLRDHMLRVHTVETVKCSICEKMLKNAKVLKAHNRAVHDEKVPCVHCGKLYGLASRMFVHVQAQHTPNEDKKHKCEVCGKGFAAKELLKDHKNIHTGEKPYLCQFCSACFASKGTHAMHERGHLGRGRKNTKK